MGVVSSSVFGNALAADEHASVPESTRASSDSVALFVGDVASSMRAVSSLSKADATTFSCLWPPRLDIGHRAVAGQDIAARSAMKSSMERGRPIAMLMNVFLTVITTSQYWRGEGRGVLEDRGLAASRGEGRGLLLCARGVGSSANNCLGERRGLLCARCEEPMDGQACKEDPNGHGIDGGQTKPSSTAAAAFGHRGVIGLCSS